MVSWHDLIWSGMASVGVGFIVCGIPSLMRHAFSIYSMCSVGVAGHQWVWHVQWSPVCVSVVCPWLWHGLSGCGIALVGVILSQWVWHSISGCGMASVGVAWPQLVWNGLSAFGMVSVDVA